MRKELFRERKQLERVVEKIDRDVDSVIVEGFCDKKVVEQLGFTGKVFMSAERALEDLVEDVSHEADKVAVITEIDRNGKEANKDIRQALQGQVDVIGSARKEFGSQLTSTGRRTVEDIQPLFHSREDKFVEASLDGLFLGE
jgi:5S rRNA maturation endonuclease (ribonuclease M5)